MNKYTYIFSLLVCSFLSLTAKAQILDCTPNKPIKTLNNTYICNNQELAQLNNQLNQKYTELKTKWKISSSNSITDKNLKNIDDYLTCQDILRGQCENTECIKNNYIHTIAQIDDAINGKACIWPIFEPQCDIYVYEVLQPNPHTSKLENAGNINFHTTQMKINLPNQCSYLILNTYAPMIWDIKTTPQTNIKAIFSAGNAPSVIRGYPENTKIYHYLSSELMKDAADCRFLRIEKNKILEIMKTQGVNMDKVHVIHETLIGENTETNDFSSNNNSVSSIIPTKEKDLITWKELEQQGIIAPLDANDLKWLWKFGLTPLNTKDFSLFQNPKAKNMQLPPPGVFSYYAVLKNSPLLARLDKWQYQFLFVPKDIDLPSEFINKFIANDIGIKRLSNKKVLLVNTFAENIKAYLQEKGNTKIVNCEIPQTIVETIICSDPALSKKNSELNNLIAKELKHDSEIIRAFIPYARHRLRKIKNMYDLNKQLQQFKSWLEGNKPNTKPMCQLSNITPDCEVYAYSSNKTEEISKDLFTSDRATTYKAKVKINRPGKCVVLFLSNYNPFIWDIYTSPQTDLRAVVIGSFMPSVIRGIKSDVLVKYRYANKSTPPDDRCLRTYVGTDSIINEINELHLNINQPQLLQTPIIGAPLADKMYEYNSQMTYGEFITPDIIPGQRGLQFLIKNGKIRYADNQDIQKIRQAGFEYISGIYPANMAANHILNLKIQNAYIMLNNFAKLPGDLAGNNSIQLFIPQGLTPPENNYGHSNLYRINATLDEVKTWK